MSGMVSFVLELGGLRTSVMVVERLEATAFAVKTLSKGFLAVVSFLTDSGFAIAIDSMRASTESLLEVQETVDSNSKLSSWELHLNPHLPCLSRWIAADSHSYPGTVALFVVLAAVSLVKAASME
jgi:hypothetical protein